MNGIQEVGGSTPPGSTNSGGPAGNGRAPVGFGRGRQRVERRGPRTPIRRPGAVRTKVHQSPAGCEADVTPPRAEMQHYIITVSRPPEHPAMTLSPSLDVVWAHAEGEVGLVITGGAPEIPGRTVADKLAYLAAGGPPPVRPRLVRAARKAADVGQSGAAAERRRGRCRLRDPAARRGACDVRVQRHVRGHGAAGDRHAADRRSANPRSCWTPRRGWCAPWRAAPGGGASA